MKFQFYLKKNTNPEKVSFEMITLIGMFSQKKRS